MSPLPAERSLGRHSMVCTRCGTRDVACEQYAVECPDCHARFITNLAVGARVECGVCDGEFVRPSVAPHVAGDFSGPPRGQVGGAPSGVIMFGAAADRSPDLGDPPHREVMTFGSRPPGSQRLIFGAPPWPSAPAVSPSGAVDQAVTMPVEPAVPTVRPRPTTMFLQPPAPPPESSAAVPRYASAAWAAVVKSPADDACRMVLSDLLTENGDPQGEFIAVQVDARGKPAKGLARHREAQLLTAHRARWTPSGVADPVFHKGLLSECVWASTTDAGHRGGQTVERLWCDVSDDGAAWRAPSPFEGPGLRALRQVYGLELRGMSALTARTRPTVETVAFHGAARQMGAEALRLGALPGLRTLMLLPTRRSQGEGDVSVEQVEGLVRDVGLRLTRLRVFSSTLTVARATELLNESVPHLTLELCVFLGSRTTAWLEVTTAGHRVVTSGALRDSERALIDRRLRAAGAGSARWFESAPLR